MGGGVMRAAAKVAGVAGVGVANAGIRSGFASLPEQSENLMRNVPRPVSAIISSPAQDVKADESVQRPSWELDDWELAGGREEESAQSLPRLVFGGTPSLEEAKAATADLKDALNTVYLSSPTHVGTDRSDLPLLSISDPLETKSCIAREFKAPVPKHAVMAFSLLNESPQVQTVVSSIASDPNVWNAVLKNESLQEFLKSQNTDVSVEDTASSKKFTELSHDEYNDLSFQSDPLGILTRVKVAVVDMVHNFSCQLQNFFGFTSTEDSRIDAEEKSGSGFNDKIGASFFGLAVMVILVIVLKRG